MSKKVFIIASTVFVILAVWFGTQAGWTELTYPLDTYQNDDVCYFNSAVTLLETGRFTRFNPEISSVHMMPGMTSLLFPFVAIFASPNAIVAFKIFSILLQVLCIYMVGLIGDKLFGRKTASVAMVCYALYLMNVLMANSLFYETVLTVLILLLVYRTMVAFEKSRGWWAVAVLWTTTMFFRPAMAAYPLVVLIIMFKQRYEWRQIFKITGIVFAIFVVMMSPWWIRNAIVFNRFIPFTLANGNPILVGATSDFIEEEFAEFEISMNNPRCQFLRYKYDEIGMDELEYAQAMNKIKAYFQENFWSALSWFTVQKSIYQWMAPFFAVTKTPRQMLWLSEIILFNHLFFVFTGFYGMVKVSFDKRTLNSVLLILLIAIYQTVHLLYFPCGRYMYPLMGFVIIFAAHALDLGMHWIRRGCERMSCR